MAGIAERNLDRVRPGLACLLAASRLELVCLLVPLLAHTQARPGERVWPACHHHHSITHHHKTVLGHIFGKAEWYLHMSVKKSLMFWESQRCWLILTAQCRLLLSGRVNRNSVPEKTTANDNLKKYWYRKVWNIFSEGDSPSCNGLSA